MNIGKNFYLSKNKLLTTVAYKIGNQKMYCYEGSIFVAGSAIQWLRDKLFFFKDSKETEYLYSKANKNESIMVVPETFFTDLDLGVSVLPVRFHLEIVSS